MSAFDVDTPWAHRLFSVYRVTIAQAKGEEASIIMRGIDAHCVEVLQRHAVDSAPPLAPGGDVTTATPPAAGRTLIHRSTGGELAVMSISHGQIIILGLALLMASWELVDQFGLSSAWSRAIHDVPFVARVTIGLILGLVGGLTATLVQFHDFRVERRPDGQLVTTYGLLARRERCFDAGAVTGLIVHRNLIELILGRARLGVITRDSGARLASNTVIPSARLEVVEAVAREHFGHLAPAPSAVPHASGVLRALVWGALTTMTAIALGVAANALGLPLWAVFLITAVGGLLLAFFGKAAATQFSWDAVSEVVHVTTLFAYRRQTSLRLRALHGVGTMAWRSAPNRLWAAWLGVYAGGPRRFLSLRARREDLSTLAEAISKHDCPLTEGTP